MIMKKDLASYFKGLTIPHKLLSLLRFENDIAKTEFFSAGFEFSIDKEKYGLKTYSENKIFLNSIYEFANADGSGSSYGFWLKDGNINLEQAPIVAFGSEGGFHVVASNLDDFLQILTFDDEPMIDWDEVYYHKNYNHFKPSAKHKEYIEWLQNLYALDPVDNPNDIVQKAQSEYKDSFNSWVGCFFKS